MIVPIAISALTAAAYIAKLRRDNKPVPPEKAAEHAVIYDTAINTVKDPDQLRLLGQAFQQAGLTAEAKMLFLRADNAEASPETKAARKEAFHKGMESTDIPGIYALAEAFETQGAPGAALALRQHAIELRQNDIPKDETSEPVSQPEETDNEQPTEQTEADSPTLSS